MKPLTRIAGRFLRVCALACCFAVVGMFVLLIGTYALIQASFEGSADLPADCGIVFGAAVYGNKYPGPAITRRVAAAVALQKEGRVGTLILSGGRAKETDRSEAEVMHAFARELGAPGDLLIMEDRSRSTWENLENSRPLTEGCSSVVGISDQYHLARIELLSWRMGWKDLQTAPAQDRPPAESERYSVIRELFAYIYYVMYLDKIFPQVTQNL